MKIYYDADITDDAELKAKTIAVLGYGIQGAAQAQCFKDAGYRVVVGLRPEGKSWNQAKQDGMNVMTVAEACQRGDVICMLTPDMTHPQIYAQHVKPNLREGKTLYFSHGFAVTYKLIQPPPGVDVIMVAPKAPGAKVRQAFLHLTDFKNPATSPIPCLVSVAQDASGHALQKALTLAKAMKLTRAGAFECFFDQETHSDLFGEQAVLCGGTTELIKAGFDTLVARGYPPEMAYFEVLHELKLIVDLIQEGGIENMWERVSETARYGGRTRGKALVTPQTRQAMNDLLDAIENGEFAKEWVAEYRAGMTKFNALKEEGQKHPIEIVGSTIRRNMVR
ncbi:ketol-acid reductoisomerase [Candidatus Micrarchaeota archaeon]|nr:ketol-acid reductoisomerase [Candidatus Micrarchaeota archaeon]